MMLDDAPSATRSSASSGTGQWGPGALRQVVMETQRFELMDDAYLRERASDVKDIGRRLLAYLQEERKQNLTYPNRPSSSRRSCRRRCSARCRRRLVGLVSVLGSGNPHVAILACAMGIPTVMGAVDLPYLCRRHRPDRRWLPRRGLHQPSAELVRQYSDVVAEERELSKGPAALRELLRDLDGHRMPL